MPCRFSVFLLTPLTAGAMPGDFDPTFGKRGVGVVESEAGYSSIEHLAIASDDRIIVGGREGKNSYENLAAFLARFLPGGEPDRSFGTDGVVRTILGYPRARIWALETYPDGRIAALLNDYDPNQYQKVVVRLLPDGSLDSTFSSDGIATPPDLRASGITLQADGGVLVGIDRAVARLNQAGELDPGFGQDGIAEVPALGGFVGDLDVDSLGRILVSGRRESAPRGDVLVGRLLSDGRIDQEFGASGFSAIPCPDWGCNSAPQLALTPEDGIVAGVDNVTDSSLRPQFYGELWALDSTGEIGATPIAANLDGSAGAFTVDPGGLIVRTAGRKIPEANVRGLGVYRLQPSGAPDGLFGQSGQALVKLSDESEFPTAIGLQSDGQIVVGGRLRGTSAVARFEVDQGTPDRDGDGTRDGADSCPIRAASSDDGCPHHRPRVVLKFGDVTQKNRGFIGYMASRHLICLPSSARPALMKARPGRDLRLGVLRNEFFAEEINSPGSSTDFAGAADPVPGVYYVRTRRIAKEALGICKSARSNRVRLG